MIKTNITRKVISLMQNCKSRITRMTTVNLSLLAIVMLLLQSTLANSQTAQTIISATGISQGICLHLGTGDGSLTTELTNSGKMYVAGIAVTETELQNTRTKILQKGLMGLVSVEKPMTIKVLPVASGSINLLVSDLDNINIADKPSDAEIKRVLSPYGAAYVKQGGSWKVIKNTMSPDYDEWKYRFYGTNGNPVSNDANVAPDMNRVRFISGMRYGMDFDGFVIDEGVAVDWSRTEIALGTKMHVYTARDAMNGMPLWKLFTYSVNHRTNHIIADGKVFLVPADGGVLTSYDLHTGAKIMEYTQGGIFSKDSLNNGECDEHLITNNGVLYIANAKRLSAVDIATGNLKWRFNSDKYVVFPVFDKDNNRIYFAQSSKNQRKTRWDGTSNEKVVALNATNGDKLWENTEFVGAGGVGADRIYPNITQIIYDNGRLYIFGASALLASNGDPFLGSIDVIQNKLLWKTHYQQRPEKFRDDKVNSYWGTDVFPLVPGGELKTVGMVLMIVNNEVIVASHFAFERINKETGAIISFNKMGEFNNCLRACGTKKYIVTGATIMADWNVPTEQYVKVSRSFITRSACAGAATPSYGGLYFATGWCSCYNSLRGVLALTSPINEPYKTPMNDANRVLTQNESAINMAGATLPYNKTNSEIVRVWTENFKFEAENRTTTNTVTEGALSIQGYISENMVVAKEGGTVKWTFLAGGRINGSLIKYNSAIYFGSADGYVYCLNSADGKMKWKFLAAREESKIGVHGQMESRWPVGGVGLSDNKITCAAGRHSEADGGIYAWRLDPTTGMPDSKVIIYNSPVDMGRADNSYAYLRKGLLCENMVGNQILSDKWDRNQFRDRKNGYQPEAASYTVDFDAWNGMTINPTTNVVNVPVTGVTLDKTIVNMTSGSVTIKETVIPTNATLKYVTWNSSDVNVAKVVGGVITAVAKGTAKIVVKTNDGGFSDTCTVNVTEEQAGLVLGFTANSSRSYEWFTLAEGEKTYTDRIYKFTSLPAKFVGQQALRTPNDDKASSSSSTLITFTAGQDMTVFVVYTTEGTQLSTTWLTSVNGWKDETVTISTDLAGVEATRFIRSKFFNKGEVVTLNGNGGQSSMYNVIVVPGYVMTGIEDIVDPKKQTWFEKAADERENGAKIRLRVFDGGSIRLEFAGEVKNIEIFDVMGRKVFSEKIASAYLNIPSSINNGYYIVRAIYRETGETLSEIFLIP
ncbi:MAG: PQQ-binding-like beta-propeller repeat protein [Paludibacter sp.]|nr:PQQ-binding-like beta-propeller repeat protein [Paludibacter sp.]